MMNLSTSVLCRLCPLTGSCIMKNHRRVTRKSYAMKRMANAIERAIHAESPSEKERSARWAAAWGLLCGINTNTARLRSSEVQEPPQFNNRRASDRAQAPLPDRHALAPSEPIIIPANAPTGDIAVPAPVDGQARVPTSPSSGQIVPSAGAEARLLNSASTSDLTEGHLHDPAVATGSPGTSASAVAAILDAGHTEEQAEALTMAAATDTTESMDTPAVASIFSAAPEVAAAAAAPSALSPSTLSSPPLSPSALSSPPLSPSALSSPPLSPSAIAPPSISTSAMSSLASAAPGPAATEAAMEPAAGDAEVSFALLAAENEQPSAASLPPESIN
jgi:hypothetical protein